MKRFVCICVICSSFLCYRSYGANAPTDKDIFKNISKIILVFTSGSGRINAKGKKALKNWIAFMLSKYPKSPYTYFVKYMFLLKQKAISEGLKKYPKVPELLYAMGQISEVKNDYKKALEYYNKALKYKSANVYDKFIAVFHYFRGNAYRNLKKFKKALKDYNTTLEIYPKYVRALINTGYIYQKVYGKFDKALTFLNKAAKINTTIYQAHFNIAEIYLIKSYSIFKKLTPAQKKKANPKMDIMLVKAVSSAICILKYAPGRYKSTGFKYRLMAYQMMCPSLRATMYMMERQQGINLPRPGAQSTPQPYRPQQGR